VTPYTLGDAEVYAAKGTKWNREDCIQYTILFNTWLKLVGETCSRATAEYCLSVLRTRPAAEFFSDLKDAKRYFIGLANADSLLYVPLKPYLRQIMIAGGVRGDLEQLRRVYTLLCFPERFTAEKADSAGSFEKFLRVNSACNPSNYLNPLQPWRFKDDRSRTLYLWLREIVREFLPDQETWERIKLLCPQTVDLSSGSTRDAGRIFSDKISQLIQPGSAHLFDYEPSHLCQDTIARITCGADGKVTCQTFERTPTFKRVTPDETPRSADGFVLGPKTMGVPQYKYTVRPRATAVPKSATEYRIICPEGVFFNSLGNTLRRRLVAALKISGSYKRINLDNQGVNRYLARVGSLPTGSWSTADLSSASDSVPRWAIKEIFPEYIWEDIEACLSTSMEVQGKSYPIQMFATSGHPATFVVESIYFLAVAELACRLTNLGLKGLCFVYGDDIVIATEAYETLMSLLSTLGHLPNASKSYSVGAFRESCGGHYWSGYDISAVYWPRHVVNVTKPEGIYYLTQLQHRLSEFPLAQAFVTDVVLNLMPEMTSSPQGEACDDLWSPLSGIDTGKHLIFCTEVRETRPTLVEYEEYVYYQYLAHGPRYGSLLDRQLGVSTSRLDVKHQASALTTGWKRSQRVCVGDAPKPDDWRKLD
jgi:hypothetical protein